MTTDLRAFNYGNYKMGRNYIFFGMYFQVRGEENPPVNNNADMYNPKFAKIISVNPKVLVFSKDKFFDPANHELYEIVNLEELMKGVGNYENVFEKYLIIKNTTTGEICIEHKELLYRLESWKIPRISRASSSEDVVVTMDLMFIANAVDKSLENKRRYVSDAFVNHEVFNLICRVISNHYINQPRYFQTKFDSEGTIEFLDNLVYSMMKKCTDKDDIIFPRTIQTFMNVKRFANKLFGDFTILQMIDTLNGENVKFDKEFVNARYGDACMHPANRIIADDVTKKVLSEVRNKYAEAGNDLISKAFANHPTLVHRCYRESTTIVEFLENLCEIEDFKYIFERFDLPTLLTFLENEFEEFFTKLYTNFFKTVMEGAFSTWSNNIVIEVDTSVVNKDFMVDGKKPYKMEFGQ